MLTLATVFVLFVNFSNVYANDIFSDNFDGYTTGSFPSTGGWVLATNGAGNSHQYVDNTQSLSPSKSLHLMGGSSCWGAAAHHPANISSHVGLSMYVKVDAKVSCGCTDALANLGLWNPSIGTWGTYYASTTFDCDGMIYASDFQTTAVLLQPYAADRWYLIRMDVNLDSKTYDVYVDDNLRATGVNFPPGSGMPTGIVVGAVHGANPVAWFDNVKLTDLGWRSGESDLGGGWKWLNWFGYYNTNFAGWIYHDQHGFLYPFDDGSGGMTFWDNSMAEFWWTKSATYPFLYRFGTGASWLWYNGSTGPRWFFNWGTGLWESTP